MRGQNTWDTDTAGRPLTSKLISIDLTTAQEAGSGGKAQSPTQAPLPYEAEHVSPMGEAENAPGPRVYTNILRGFLPQEEGQETLFGT